MVDGIHHLFIYRYYTIHGDCQFGSLSMSIPVTALFIHPPYSYLLIKTSSVSRVPYTHCPFIVVFIYNIVQQPYCCRPYHASFSMTDHVNLCRYAVQSHSGRRVSLHGGDRGCPVSTISSVLYINSPMSSIAISPTIKYINHRPSKLIIRPYP